MTNPIIDEAQIRETAYLMWLDAGQPHGADQEHWQKAIDALTPAQPKAKRTRKAPAKAPAKAAAKAPAKKPRATKAKAPAKAAAVKADAGSETKTKAAPAAKKPRATRAKKAVEK